MAHQCYVEPVARHRALLAFCFSLIVIMVGMGIGWFYTVKYYEDHRTYINVTMSPSKLQLEWNCRLCDAKNTIVEVIQ